MMTWIHGGIGVLLVLKLICIVLEPLYDLTNNNAVERSKYSTDRCRSLEADLGRDEAPAAPEVGGQTES